MWGGELVFGFIVFERWIGGSGLVFIVSFGGCGRILGECCKGVVGRVGVINRNKFVEK